MLMRYKITTCVHTLNLSILIEYLFNGDRENCISLFYVIFLESYSYAS